MSTSRRITSNKEPTIQTPRAFSHWSMSTHVLLKTWAKRLQDSGKDCIILPPMESLKCLKFRGLWNWRMSTPRLWIHDESTTKVQQALPKFNCFQLRNQSKITQRSKSQAIIKHQRNNTETASLFSAPWCVGQMNPRDSVKGKLCLGVQHFMVEQHVVRTSKKITLSSCLTTWSFTLPMARDMAKCRM